MPSASKSLFLLYNMKSNILSKIIYFFYRKQKSYLRVKCTNYGAKNMKILKANIVGEKSPRAQEGPRAPRIRV